MILLGNYNFYPFHAGGSEVYVAGLAGYLQDQGEKVRIVAAIPADAYPPVFTGTQIRVAFYTHENLMVAGVWLKAESTRQIYAKYDPVHVADWINFFRQFPDWLPAVFHLHGYTGTVNTAISEAVRSLAPQVLFLFSYHTPVSCPKGTLYRMNRETCTLVPDVQPCTACLLNHYAGIPEWLAPPVSLLLPPVSAGILPARLKMKSLVSDDLDSFRKLTDQVDHWYVFSDYILDRVRAGKVPPEKITRIRHGISPLFTGGSPDRPGPELPVTFIFMGRLEKIKGILTLINAWQMLPESDERKLILIGMLKPETPAEIKLAIEDLARRKDVEIRSGVSREKIPAVLDSGHCMIIPSEWVEIGPLVFHEAIARGLNVLASDIGGTRELASVYGAGCRTFKTGDAGDLRQKIQDFSWQPVHKPVQTETEHYQQVYSRYPGRRTP